MAAPLAALAVIVGVVLMSGAATAATPAPATVDGVIGPEWAATTPTFVDYTDEAVGGAIAFLRERGVVE